MEHATIETLIETAADCLQNAKVFEREVQKAEDNLRLWTERLVSFSSKAEKARQSYAECLAEINKRKEGD